MRKKIYIVEFYSKYALQKKNSHFKSNIFSINKNKKKRNPIISEIKMRSKKGLPSIIERKDITKEEELELKNILNYELIYPNNQDELNILNTINKNILLDVFGDIHGRLDRFKKKIQEIGYDENLEHPTSRKILILGDFIDKGPDSLNMIKLTIELQKKGHFIIKGNHEDLLLKNIERFELGEELKGSKHLIKTAKEVLEDNDKENIKLFLQDLPTYFIQDDFAFCHADIKIFNPMETTDTVLMYGENKYQSKISKLDKDYQDNFDKGINKYTLIRGHTEGENTFKNIFSLDFDKEFGRLDLDLFKKTGSFIESTTKI